MTLRVPELSLIVLVGASGCGKSTFARTHFLPTEILSSDACRGIVWDDENAQEATDDAFALLHTMLRLRLKNGKLTVIDATNVRSEDRKALLRIAFEYHVRPIAVVFALPEQVCQERNSTRSNRQFGTHVVHNHTRLMRQSLREIEREGFRDMQVLRTPEQVDEVTVERTRLWTDLRSETGPFDIVGDIHGCAAEFRALLDKLGYAVEPLETPEQVSAAEVLDRAFAPMPSYTAYYRISHPEGRRLVVLGDLVDRGPDSVDVLKLAMSIVASKAGLCVPGNHDARLVRALRGRKVNLSHGLAETMEQLAGQDEQFRTDVSQFLDSLVSHFVLDGGALVVAHAGMKEEMQGRASGRVRDFALYGETTGETDEYGLPIRYPWAKDYRGRANVIYGHTPVPEAEWVNGTMCIDTGCVFGGKLTALRYPEMDVVDVPARAMYSEPLRPLVAVPSVSAQHALDDMLDLEDVRGKRLIHTRLRGNITIREENATAALEAMSRFATNPKWLVYLPPTMSPTETSREEGLLEHPNDAFSYYRSEGIDSVICEQKHMGSRAVVVLCRSDAAARSRFGVDTGERGVIVTRTGRRFFDDLQLETQLLERIDLAMVASKLWDRLDTDWIILDCELMPWSAKAQDLLRRQYAPVGASAQAATKATADAVGQALARLPGDELLQGLLARVASRHEAASAFVDAYRQYCWPVDGLEDLRLAPFQILATEGRTRTDESHAWHMETLAGMCAMDGGVLMATPHLIVDLRDEAQVAKGVEWWTHLTERGGEGMVVKPLGGTPRGAHNVIQPAVKCRGKEYLRIIYGLDYTMPENLTRLRSRGLGRKRSLALREFALGLEALERFIEREPLRRVHECVFAVLALESEPVDPRL